MIALEAGDYRLALSPEHGATVLSAGWRHPRRGWIALLEPLADPAGMKAGCFVMAPFANRIADGRFRFEGTSYRIPVNLPEESMAIHGIARDRPWQVLETAPGRAGLALRCDDPGLPWRFELRQDVTLTPEGIGIALRIVNTGPHIMPFGLGLHPWFRKPAGATLSFTPARAHRRDARGLPLPETAERPEFVPGTARPLAEVPLFDGCFAGWSPREARIDLPGDGLRITLSAGGALGHLHVYVPDDRPVFCAEPVSHLPDAVNRPELGAAAAMAALAPGEALSGAMILAARALDPGTALPQEAAR